MILNQSTVLVEYILTADIANDMETELLTCQLCIFTEGSKFFVQGSCSVLSMPFIHFSCFSAP
jgi:hypothetical protein